MKIKDYKKRIADELLDFKLNSFGATLIVGPKGCGKTTTASEKAKSIIEFQDEDFDEDENEIFDFDDNLDEEENVENFKM